MKRPSIKSPCVADRYHHGAERIAEFIWRPKKGKAKGGLVSLSVLPDGKLLVSVHNCDPGVIVRAGPALVEWRDGGGGVGAQPVAVRGDYRIGRRDPVELEAGDE